MFTRAMINKPTARFLRENTQISFDYIEKITTFDKQLILHWEDCSNGSLPTINQAKKLAKCYRIPFAGLYMNASDICQKHLPKIKNMRTIQNPLSQDDSALNLAVFDLLNARELLLETKSELDETIPDFLFEITEYSVFSMASTIRKIFNLEFEVQLKLPSQRQFYLYVREQIEKKEILVQCFTGVDTEIARGVAIYYDTLPIIGINALDRYPAKTFSIIHELVHIIKRTSSMCNDLYSSFSSADEEIFCNAVAGEVLVPQDILKNYLQRLDTDNFDEDTIVRLANIFSISKEVVIRRLLDTGHISKAQYSDFADMFKQLFERERAIEKERRKVSGLGGIPQNVSMLAFDKTSHSLSNALFRSFGEGHIDKQDISRYLGIAHKHVDKFLREVSK